VLDELTDRYGEPPEQVTTLIAVSKLRRAAQKAGLGEVVAMGGKLRIAPADLPDSIQIRLQRLYPGARYFAAPRTISVPMPEGLGDRALIEWTSKLMTQLFPEPVAVTAS
jgi:transcription-repair coupling factor (superfamily II helicase)